MLRVCPWVQAIVGSRASFGLFRRYAFKPLLFTSLLIAVLSLVARDKLSVRTDCGLFLAMNVLLNSRLGGADEMVTDWVVRVWHHLRIRISLPVPAPLRIRSMNYWKP